jgi:hypothetical protein
VPLSDAAVAGWCSALFSNGDALSYLLGRGLSEATISTYKLGWNQNEKLLTLPVYAAEGELVNVRRRSLASGAKFRGLFGHGSQLYPDVPWRGPILLLAGEFDALIGRQHGLPAVTSTCGSALPDSLAPELAGRRVAVAYDVGEESAAKRTVAKLRSVGSLAWVVRLQLLRWRTPGTARRKYLPIGGDLNDYFLAGGDADALLDLIRREGQRT